MELRIQTLGILLLLQVGSVFLWDKPKRAEPGQFPHLVSIDWSLPPNILNIHSCSGAIINELWVITSAYCVYRIPYENMQVRAGCHNLTHIDQHVQSVGTEKTIFHKKYAGRRDLDGMVSYDIGLIKLKSPLMFNDRVRPAKLPRKKNWFTPFKADYNMIMSGWGSTAYSVFTETDDVLRTVNLPAVSNRVCMDSIRTLVNLELHETQMCTRPLDGTGASCIADNGSPLIQYDDFKAPVVVGILTWNYIPCNTFGMPPIYTRVAPFVDWIDKEIKRN